LVEKFSDLIKIRPTCKSKKQNKPHKQEVKNRAGGMAQVVECLPKSWRASSNPSTTTKKREGRGGDERGERKKER
jgi:hypothetical protein